MSIEKFEKFLESSTRELIEICINEGALPKMTQEEINQLLNRVLYGDQASVHSVRDISQGGWETPIRQDVGEESE